MKTTKMMVALSVCAMTATAMADVYTDEASFLANITDSYANGFDDAVTGPIASLSYDNGTYSYTVSASGDAAGTLYNDTGLVSTDSALDGILVSFTGAAVTAVGGNFWATDVAVLPTGTDIVITLSDGTVESFTSTGASDFRGFTSDIAISSIFIDALDVDPDAGPYYWATMDNLVVGSAIPTPGSLALLGMGGLAASRRRRA